MKTEFVVDRENREVRMSRVFDAPRERLRRAHLDPKEIPLWWGPRMLTTTVEELDARVGGKWRFVHHDEDGNEHLFHGTYTVLEPDHLAQTFIWEGEPDQILHEDLLLEDLPDGKTRIRVASRYPSVEALDAAAASGMEAGARESWDRLAELVEPKRPEAGAEIRA